jgi:RNA polymerase sigma factor (sigma-70 family)
MEASALKYHAGIGLPSRSPLLRLQSDERLITLLRRGNTTAFEVLVSRYESRLLAFCRHLLGSREDAEDVLQEVMTAAFNAIVADDRPINVRPWLYRIARNRSLNHLRRTQAIGVDSMDHHFAENGTSTAEKVHQREEFRLLVGDIQGLPETQRTALVLREMDALSYEQIAEAMETTVSSVKSLLVRARVSLTEAAEARLLSCEEVRMELAAIAEGLQKRPSPLVRRHLKDCKRCAAFKTQLKATNRALAALLPVGPLVVIRKLAFLHLGHSAGYGAGSTAGATAAGSTASAGAGAALGASGALSGGSFVSAGMGAVATKAAAGLAAAVIVTAGAVEVDQQHSHAPAKPAASVPVHQASQDIAPVQSYSEKPSTVAVHHSRPPHHPSGGHRAAVVHHTTSSTATTTTTTSATTPTTSTTTIASVPTTTTTSTTATTPGTTQIQTDPTTVPTTTTAPAPPLSSPTTPTEPTTPTTTSPTTTTTPTTTAPTTSTPTTTTGAMATVPTSTGRVTITERSGRRPRHAVGPTTWARLWRSHAHARSSRSHARARSSRSRARAYY